VAGPVQVVSAISIVVRKVLLCSVFCVVGGTMRKAVKRTMTNNIVWEGGYVGIPTPIPTQE